MNFAPDTDLILYSLTDMLGSGGALSKYLQDDGSDAGNDEDAFDAQDLIDDPVYNLDMKVCLCELFPGQCMREKVD